MVFTSKVETMFDQTLSLETSISISEVSINQIFA
jgi:hypothetical protein